MKFTHHKKLDTDAGLVDIIELVVIDDLANIEILPKELGLDPNYLRK